MKKLIIIFISLIMLTGCTNDAKITKITGSKAKELIKEDAVLIDVRTKEEFDEGHIEGAINIPHTEISKIDYDKNTEIIVYCRSGNRSNLAAAELISLGYTSIYDLGSIDNY